MKISWKSIQTILIILLSFLLFIGFSKYDSMKKGMDQIFFGAITDSTNGFAKDYSKLSNDEKTRIYYETISGLKTAQETFHLSSYKEHEGVFQVLNELYIYLLIYDTKNDDYEIEDKSYIYDTIWKIVWQPENEELVKEFNEFIDNKKKILSEKKGSILELPPTKDILSVEIAGGIKDTIITDKEIISSFIKKVEESTPTTKQSVQDVPTVSVYTRIDFISQGNISSIFIYEENSKWYIEQPYNGIYETDNTILELLENE